MPGRRTLAAATLAALVVAGGCLTVDIASEVEADGTVERYEIEMRMPAMVLEEMNRSAEQNGTTVAESIRSGYDRSKYEEVSVEVTREDDQGVIRITLVGFDPAEVRGSKFSAGGDGAPEGSGPQIEVTREDNRLVYVDRSFLNESAASDGGDGEDGDGDFGSAFELTYRLKMPGDVVPDETNADRIDGDVAVWERSGENVLSNTSIRAVSGINDPPTAGFSVTPTSPRKGEKATFDAGASADPDDEDLVYEWDFDGDGDVEASGERVEWAFDSTGDHEVILIVTDEHGANDTATRTVSVSSAGFLGLPGFGALAAVVAIALVTIALAARLRSRAR